MAGAATMTNQVRRRFAGSTHSVSDWSAGSKSTSLRIAALSMLLSLPLLAAGTTAWSQTGLRFEAMQAVLGGEPLSSAPVQSDDPVSALADYVKISSGARSPHGSDAHGANQSLLDYTQQLEAERPQLISADQPAHAAGGDGAFAALAAFAEQLQARDPDLKFAEAKTKPV